MYVIIPFFFFLTEFSFFDPNDAACQEILFNPKTSIPELFAILRQWVPQVQQNIDVIGNEVRKSLNAYSIKEILSIKTVNSKAEIIINTGTGFVGHK